MVTVNRSLKFINYITKPCLISIALILAFTASAKELTKTIKKEYEVKKDALLRVSNKYGSIHCENWNKSSVMITVNVRVEHRSESKAVELLDDIHIDITGDAKYVEAITKLDNARCGGGCEIEIDYDVKMPPTLDIDFL